MCFLLDKTNNNVKHNVITLTCSRFTAGKCSVDIQKARHGKLFLDLDCSHKFSYKSQFFI